MRLISSDLGLKTRAAVYVNEHFCPEVNELLGQAPSKKQEHGWKSVRVRNGQNVRVQMGGH